MVNEYKNIGIFDEYPENPYDEDIFDEDDRRDDAWFLPSDLGAQ